MLAGSSATKFCQCGCRMALRVIYHLFGAALLQEVISHEIEVKRDALKNRHERLYAHANLQYQPASCLLTIIRRNSLMHIMISLERKPHVGRKHKNLALISISLTGKLTRHRHKRRLWPVSHDNRIQAIPQKYKETSIKSRVITPLCPFLVKNYLSLPS